MEEESQMSRLFELCDSDAKGYLTKTDLNKACPQLSPKEIGFIFSCLDTNNSGTIEKSEFVAGFEETLFKGESRGFGGIQERVPHNTLGRTNSTVGAPQPSTIVVLTNDDDDDRESNGGGRMYGTNHGSRSISTSYPGRGRVATGDEEVFMEEEEDAWNRSRARSKSASPAPGGGGGDYLETGDDMYGFDGQLSPSTLSYLSSKKPKSTQSLRSAKFLKKRPQAQFSVDIPCKDEVLQLYEELQSSGVPQIMTKFEEVVGNLCREIDQKREENQLLQTIQKAERDNYNKRMNEIENEIDQQLMMAEKKAREEERQRLTKEKQELKERLESEMTELQSNIEHLQKMEKVLRKESAKTGDSVEHSVELKGKLDNIAKENRTLKNNLADNHLEMTLIKAELAELKSEFESKALSNVYETAECLSNANETENMNRQLQLLYDANKRLHDTNDNLRGALDQRTSIIRQLHMAKQPVPAGYQLGVNDSAAAAGQFHQSHSTMTMGVQAPGAVLDPSNSLSFLNPDDDDRDSGFPNVRSVSSRTSISDVDLFRCASVDTARESTSNYTSSLVEFCGPPDRTFRVVMCGDSSVGKSSIIMRIVKGVYQRNIASTLGVDFHVKCIKMGKTNVAVQLWDTAGQERFRSLCNSYFRRADGAILVYDCSVERSFLRIRDWIETVKESVCKTIPILLVGNKIDLRRQREDAHGGPGPEGMDHGIEFKAGGESLAEIFDDGNGPSEKNFQPSFSLTSTDAFGRQTTFGRQETTDTIGGANFVSQKEGENLAKVLETEFIECSALDGTNVEAALLLLVGEMMKQEDIQMKNTTVELSKPGKKKANSSCFSCRST